MLQFRFWTIWSQKKILVSEKFGIRKSLGFGKKLVSEKSLGFGFGKLGIGKKVSVSVLVKILVSSLRYIFLLQSNSLGLKWSDDFFDFFVVK